MPPAAILVALLLSTAAFCAEPEAEAPAGTAPPLLLGSAYPIEAPLSFPAALMHWLDSLAHLRGIGLTAGKTIEAHRQAFVEALDIPTAEDQRLLEVYHRVRVGFNNSGSKDRYALTRAFFEAREVDEALERAGSLLGDADRASLNEAVRHFATRYQRIWNGGEIPRDFLKRSAGYGQREKLEEFLVDVAAFYGVQPGADPAPRLVLAPVPAGAGTHAQAIDRFLLVEVRSKDGLQDQIAPIVHENAHLLFHRMGNERIKALEAAALAHGAMGQAAWQHLQEALPTAIAQGVAQLTFEPSGWSFETHWYDVEIVDIFAKRIFPKVKQALARGRQLDSSMIDELVEVYAGSVATRRAGPAAAPRSP